MKPALYTQYIRYLAFLLCLVINTKLNATHIVGAEMSYKNIGGNTFEFTLYVYRDCQGIPVQPMYRIDYSSLSCNIQGNFPVNMISSLTTEVSPVCPYIPTICSGGTQDGIQRYVFKGNFTLPQACTDWVFSWRECNRNHDITTVINPDAQCLYIESRLNSVVAPDNNSPTFNNPPVSILCTGQPNYINPGTAEADGDQMVFSAITPKTSKFKDIVYRSPFSASNPLTSSSGYSVNSQNGDIAVTPTVSNEVTVLALKVEEYRNGVLIGSTIRDIQVLTRNCNNNNPVLSGIDKTTSTTRTVCAGNQICFDIFGSDTDAGQKLTMEWDRSINGASFTVSGDSVSPKGRFCWNTSPGDAGTHFFTVTLKDDFCPIRGITTRSYTIVVTPSPTITLASPVNIPCNSTTTLNPSVSGGNPPYVYKWSTGATTPTITAGNGAYELIVTDSRGCKARTSIRVQSGVRADFNYTKVCSTRTVNFRDSSFSLIGNVISWQWNFGDPASGAANTSTLMHPSHTYTTHGIFDVKLVVTDDTGCKDSIVKKVKICDFPTADFSTLDSCQNKEFIFIIDRSTANLCGISKISGSFGNINFQYLSPPAPIYFPPGISFPVVQSEKGWIPLNYTVTNEDGCVSSVSRMIHVAEAPEIDILQNNFVFDCSKPDTILTAMVNPSKGKPPFVIRWDNGTIGPTRAINKPGLYSVIVTDANGCVDIDVIEVLWPLQPQFTNTPYCEVGDTIRFIDSTKAHWGLVSWQWKFGDGNSYSTTNPALKNPQHTYDSTGVYLVTLIVRDSKGCLDSARQNFYFVLPDNHFVVEPTPFCIGQQLTLESPRGLYIDSLIWSMGNGVTFKVGKNQFSPFPIPPLLPSYYYYNTNYTYPSGSEGNTYTVTLTMKYNNNQCIRNYSRDVSIYPAFDVEIDSIVGKFCSGDTIQFFASQKIGSPVTSWLWEFRLQDNIPPFNKILVAISSLQNPKMVFNKGGNYFITLKATNTDGCEEVIRDYGFSIIQLPKPVFCVENPCVNQQTKFFYFCSNFPEVAIDSVHWHFGDGANISVQEPFHIYADSGLYNVRCEIFNTTFQCSNDTTIATRIYMLPVPDFIANPVCLGNPTYFTDMSVPSYQDTIKRWSWDFGDGYSFSTNVPALSSPTHTYAQAGVYNASLYVESKISNCVDTITKPVFVHSYPDAGFSFVENELVLNRPILFTDESSNAIKWLWIFSDGDSVLIMDPLNRNVEHTFSGTVKTVTITQIVYNEHGCTDTLVKTLDLSIHLLLPSAFSPNGDGLNDVLKLTYKGIAELKDFSIYNRWGEKIFDAKGNLDAFWDGTYKGQEQPLGSYVYYVRAVNFANEEIAFSGNVTLLR